MSPDRDDDIREMLRRRADAMMPRGTYGDLERRLASEGVAARSWQRPVLAGVAAVFALLVGVGVIALATDQPDNERVDTTDLPATDDGSTTSSPSTAPPETTVAPPPETTATAPQTTVTSAVATTTADPPTPPPASTTTPAPTTTATPITATPTTATPTTIAPPTAATTPPATSPLTDDTRVTLRGIGSLSLPLAKADVTAITGQRLLDDGEAPGGAGCGYVTPEGGPSGLTLMTNGDQVVRVDVHDNSAVRTVSGIGIGTSQAEVSAAYPGSVIRPGKYSGLDIIVADASAPDHRLIFQVLNGKVLAYRSGVTEFVNYVEGCS